MKTCQTVAILCAALVAYATAFAPIAPTARSPSFRAVKPLAAVSNDSESAAKDHNAAAIAAFATAMTPFAAHAAETEAWVQPLSLVLGPLLNFFSVAMLCRIVLSWYPTANVNEFPFSLAVWPTEPLLRLVRDSIPPAFGVDISPVVMLGIFSFLNEILLGQQGLLVMKMKYGI